MTQPINEVRTKEEMERDPVCGMSVEPNKAAAKVEHGGKTYYFCAPGCAKRFRQTPAKYLQPVNKSSAPSWMVSLHNASQSAAAAAPASKRKSRPDKYDASVSPAARAGHPQPTF